MPMHGAAQTANAPPSSSPEPVRRAPSSSPGAAIRVGTGSRPMNARPEHDQHEALRSPPRLGVDDAAERSRAGADQDEDHA